MGVLLSEIGAKAPRAALRAQAVCARTYARGRRRIGDRKCRSLLLSVERRGASFLLKGRGWGHGVGLCQVDAIEMARRGRTFRDILGHYYPGAEISPWDDSQRR